MTSFSAPQQKYIAAFSKESGLNPGVVSAWVAAEEPVGATERVGASRVGASQDWLNIGITDSGPKGAGNTNWDDPVAAGTYGAKWLKGQVSIPGFGHAAPGIVGIAKTAGQSPMAQIAAIKSSGWASGGYPDFESIYNQFKGNAPAIDASSLASVANTKVAGPGATVTPGKTTTTTTAPQVDWASAGIQALLSSARKKIDTSGKFTASSPLGGLLYNVNSGAYTTPGSTKTTTTPATTTSTALAKVANAKAAPVKLDPSDIQGLEHLTGTTTPKTPWNPEGKPVADWIAPILQAAWNAGVKFSLSSGYRSYADQKRIYDSGVRPAAVPGTSNHEGDAFPRGAVDIGSGQDALSSWLNQSPYKGVLVFAGSKDPVHFSHPHDGGY